MWVHISGDDRALLILELAGTILPLLALASEIPAVVLVRRENTLPSVRRSDLLESWGDDGGVVSEDVALSIELDLGIRVKLFFRLITGEGLGLAGGTYSFLLRLGEADGILVALFCLRGKLRGGGINELSEPFITGADIDMTIGGGFSWTRITGVSSGVSITGLRTGTVSSPAYNRSSGVAVRRRA